MDFKQHWGGDRHQQRHRDGGRDRDDHDHGNFQRAISYDHGDRPLKRILLPLIIVLLFALSAFAQNFDFPSSPTLNQIVVGPSGQSFQWDGTKWIAVLGTGGGGGLGFTAGGDLSGTAISQTVIGIRGTSVPALATGYLHYTGTAFTWDTPVGGGPGGGITSITAGTGLTGGTITTSGTIALAANPTGGQLNFAPLASPAFTGTTTATALQVANTLTAPTASFGNATINTGGVLMLAGSAALYFNGVAPGGTCPGGQFVNAISATIIPTCATPAGGGAFLPLAGGTMTGNITFSDAGKILANMSGTPRSNRFVFQDNQGGGLSNVGIIPPVGGSSSYITVYGSTDVDNSSFFQTGITAGGKGQFTSNAFGTGTVLPFAFTVGATEVMDVGNGTAGSNGLNLLSGTYMFNGAPIGGTCGAGTFVSAMSGTGGLTCTTPAAGGTGTVTSIVAGTGLTGGTITTTGTIALSTPVSIANGGTQTNTAPTSGQILIAQSATSYLPRTVATDLAINATGAATVNGIKGAAIPALAAGYLHYTGSAFAWDTPGGATVPALFTPTIIASTTNPTVTYTSRSGWWTNLGNGVSLFSIYLSWSAFSGGSGNVSVSGYPVSLQGGTSNYACWTMGVTMGSGFTEVALFNPSGGTSFFVAATNSTTATTGMSILPTTAFAGTGLLSCQGWAY